MGKIFARMGLEVFAALALGALAVAVVGMAGLDYAAPLRVHRDYVVQLFNAASLLRFGTVYANPEVAFPGGGEYMGFPTPDIVQMALLRAMGFFTANSIVALNAFGALCFFTAAVSAYWALRWTKVSRWLAGCGALMFACSPLMCERVALHLFVCFTVALPWLLRFCLLLFYQRPRLGRKAFRLGTAESVLVGLAAASCGLYYAFFSGFFLALALSLLALNGARGAALRPGLVALGVLVGGFLFWLAPNLWYAFDHHLAFPERSVFQQTLYGVRLPDMFVPSFLPSYRFYAAAQEQISSEGNYAILSLWSMVGLVGAALLAAARLVRFKAALAVRRLPMFKLTAVLTAAALLFAMPYGLGLVFNMLVGGTIRAQTRVGAFLLYLAILAALLLAERWRRRWRRPVFYAATGALLFVSLAPVYQAVAVDQAVSRPAWDALRASYGAALAQLDKRGLDAVAQLPSYYYPEGPASSAFGNSDHFWPYLLDAGRKHHWSFGSMLHQPQWQTLATVEAWPPQDVFAALRCLGYDALLLEKQALDAARVARLQGALKPAMILSDDPQRTLIDVSAVPPDSEICARVSDLKFGLAGR